MITLLGVTALSLLLVSVILALSVLCDAYDEAQAERERRLHLQRHVRQAERQLHDLTSDAFQRMLDTARRSEREGDG